MQSLEDLASAAARVTRGTMNQTVVLQLGPYPPPYGGVQTNLVAIREHLNRHQIASPLINLTRHRRTNAENVYYPRTGWEVVSLLCRIPADIIHVHIGGMLTARLLLLCLVCSLIPRRRVVLTFHSGGYPSFGRTPRRFSLPGVILRRLDAVIAVNAELAELFRRLGVAPSRIKVICPYAPIALRTDTPVPETIQGFRRAHSPLLTTVSGLEPEYDVPLQIEALATIRRTWPDAGLVIVGGGSQEAEIRRLITGHPHGSHILLCGDLPHAVTLQVVSASDVFLRTTLYDGDSISVREALQLGVPVIATDNGMRPAGVHLIPRSDAAALSRTVAAVLNGTARPVQPIPARDQPLDEVLELYGTLLGRAIRGITPAVPSAS
jgi:glycogen synthase